MNEKLLAMYLERVLLELDRKISEADDDLGEGVLRNKSTNFPPHGMNLSQFTGEERDDGFTVIGDAIALDGLREFSDRLKEDINWLQEGPERTDLTAWKGN